MQYETITLDITDGLAVLTLNRPDVMNALNTQMRAEITHAVGTAADNARVLVMTGAGRAFCSGQGLGNHANIAHIDLERVLRDEYTPLLRSIYDCPIPTISAVNGAAAGAGANIALAADVVIASESAFFMQAFSKIGLIPDAGGTYWLPRQMGFANAMGAALFAEKISGTDASAMGLIWECVADEAFEDVWRSRAEHLATGPTLAYRNIKKAMRAAMSNDLDAQLALEAHLQGECGKSRDFKEGILAFSEKRNADFEGR